MRFEIRSVSVKSARVRIVIAAMCALAFILTPANAQDGSYQAGVIIDYGDDRITWVWIPFDEPETPLIDLLDQTELEMVTVGFGGLGQGVCQIDDTGCPAADCRQRMCQTSSSSPFWRLMKLGGEDWSMISSGLSGTKVVDGEIYALSWSAENPELPVVTIDELASRAGSDRDVSAPIAAVRTEGESANANSGSASWELAAGALVFVMVVAGVLIYRARSSRGTTS